MISREKFSNKIGTLSEKEESKTEKRDRQKRRVRERLSDKRGKISNKEESRIDKRNKQNRRFREMLSDKRERTVRRGKVKKGRLHGRHMNKSGNGSKKTLRPDERRRPSGGPKHKTLLHRMII